MKKDKLNIDLLTPKARANLNELIKTWSTLKQKIKRTFNGLAKSMEKTDCQFIAFAKAIKDITSKSIR